MRKNVEKVVNAFLSGTSHAEKSLSTDGDVIRSYDMAIAQRLPSGRIEVVTSDLGPTQTTKQHISGVAIAIDLAGHDPLRVGELTGRKPHTFRDRAGDEGYLDRHRPLRAPRVQPLDDPSSYSHRGPNRGHLKPTMTDVRAAAAASAWKRLKVVK